MKENNQMDERQVQINLKAMCFGGGFMSLGVKGLAVAAGTEFCVCHYRVSCFFL